MSPLSVFAAGAIALGSIIAGPAAYAACEEEIAELDRRLADPGLNDRQRQVVQGMRQSADYLCGAGKEEDVRNMLDRLDTMLNAPGIGSPLPGQADTAPARSAAASKPERQIRQSTTGDAIPDKGQWIDRPEDMFQYWYHDVDFSDGKLRVLYSTSPSLEQGQAGPWTANVYVAEIAGNGETDQHRLYSKEALETVTMALLPGQDKVLVQMRALGSGKPERLEVWSIPDGNVLSSNEIPHPRGPKDERWNWAQFRAITLDGNAIFTTTQFSGRRADPPVSVSGWMEVTPDGQVVGKGTNRLEHARQMIRFTFPAHTGGAGLALDISALDERGLSGLMEEPVIHEVGNREVRGILGREMRLLITDSDTQSMTLGPDLERDLMWVGEMSAPRDLPATERMAQSQEQMRLMQESEVASGARRNLRVIKPTAKGYGLLMRIVANRNMEPPVHGQHFVEIGLDGVRRELYLEPIGDDLDVKFEDFAAGRDGTIYLLAQGNSRSDYDALILPIDNNGQQKPAVSVSVPDRVTIDEIFATPSDVWLIGHGMNEATEKVSLWVERVSSGDLARN